jgi:hypothetical protein
MHRRSRSTGTAIALAVGLMLVCSVGTAGEEQAREYFKEAKKAYANKEYDRAADLLEKAYAEEANLTYQYNRIRALQGAERYEEALDVLETYEQPLLDADGFEDIPQIKQSLREKTGATTTSEESETTNSESSTVGGTPTTEPGGGNSAGSDRSPELEALGWGLSGVGVASIGVGSLFGSLLLLPPDVRENAREDRVQPENVDLVRSHKTATIVFLTAGTGALVGGGILLYNQLTADGGRARLEDGTGPRVRWRPYAAPDAAGATLEIRY